MHYVPPVSLVIAGLIHLLPLVGMGGADKLQTLYGVSIENPDLVVLMRHRALLFGLLGTAMVSAAFVPSLRPPVIAAGLISTGGFLLLAGSATDALENVIAADVVAMVVLGIGGLCHLWTPPAGTA